MASTSNRLHWLPCSIEHDGTAPVSEYFHPEKTGTISGDLVVEEATLRGRRLVGATYPLPGGYVAYMLPKGQKQTQEHHISDEDPTHSLIGLPTPTTWKSASPAVAQRNGGDVKDDSGTLSTSSSSSAAPTSLTYWKLDEHPTPQDAQRRALDWVATARAVATHVGRGEVEAAMKG